MPECEEATETGGATRRLLSASVLGAGSGFRSGLESALKITGRKNSDYQVVPEADPLVEMHPLYTH